MISLAHRTVYVHIPKCGGQSVEEAFCADLGLDWAKHRRLLMMFSKPANDKSWKGRTNRLAHLTAHEYIRHEYLPRTLWNEYFTFATVRNPFKLLESRYFFTESKKHPEFSAFVLDFISTQSNNFRFRPQTSYLEAPSGKGLVKRVYALEGIGDTWGDIRERAGVSADLPHRNKSQRSPVVWTEEARDVVRKVYAKDFERLGFSLEDGTPRETVIDFS